MTIIDISADTPEEALEDGLRQLGIAREDVDMQVLSSAHDDTLPGAEPLPGVTVRLTVKEDVLVGKARQHLLKILEIMGINAQLEVLRRRGGYVLNIHAGEDDSLIIGKNGQNLEALQVCVNRMVVHGGRDLFPIFVDCENYMDKRLERLERLAQRCARQAERQGVEVPLEPMTPFERKIVHNAIKDFRKVHTVSRGEGRDRHIVVVPGGIAAEAQLRPYRGYTGNGAGSAVQSAAVESDHDETELDLDNA